MTVASADGGSLAPGVSVVVPVFNGAATLPALVDELRAAAGEFNRPFELILVNDGSSDESWEVVREIATRHAEVRGFNLMRNFGQHNALLCGIRQAGLELVATLDDDGQNPPAAIARLLDELEQGYDLVYGSEAVRRHGLWRNLGSRLTRFAVRLMTEASFADHVSSFRLFRTRLRETFAEFNGPAVSIDVLLSWGTTRVSSVLVEHRARAVGQSNYGVRRLAAYAFDMITGFSTLPLKLASWVGFALTLFGFLALAYVVGSFLVYGRVMPGFAFLASIIVILGGGQLFAIGMIGEYLARMHGISMKRPAFVIAEAVGHGVEARADSPGQQP